MLMSGRRRDHLVGVRSFHGFANDQLLGLAVNVTDHVDEDRTLNLVFKLKAVSRLLTTVSCR